MSGNTMTLIDYQALANLHKPVDESGLRIAANELSRQGLKVRDVAEALRVSIPEVLALLAPKY